MLSRTTLFANENRTKMFRDICKSELQLPVDALDLIKQLLIKDPFFHPLTTDRRDFIICPGAF
jgi:hypothetical protein